MDELISVYIQETREQLAEMESGQLPLEASLAAYKRGAELMQYCRQQLAAAEQQVQMLESGSLQPFRTDSADE